MLFFVHFFCVYAALKNCNFLPLFFKFRNFFILSVSLWVHLSNRDNKQYLFTSFQLELFTNYFSIFPQHQYISFDGVEVFFYSIFIYSLYSFVSSLVSFALLNSFSVLFCPIWYVKDCLCVFVWLFKKMGMDFYKIMLSIRLLRHLFTVGNSLLFPLSWTSSGVFCHQYELL